MYLDRRLLALTRGVRARILLAAFLGLLETAAGVARLALSGYAIALVFRGASLPALIGPVGAVAGAIVLRSIFQFAREMMAHHTAAAVKVALRRNLAAHVLALGPGHLDERRTGDVLLSLVEGVEMLESFFGQYLPQLLVAALAPVAIFAFMATLDLPTAFIFLGFALLTLATPALFHRWTRNSSMARRRAYAEMGSDFVDAVQGLPTLKAFGQSRAHGERLAARARALFHSTMMVLAVNIAGGGLAMLSISAGAALALGWGAVRVSRGELDLAPLLVVLLLGVEVFRPLRELTQLYHRGMIATSAAMGIFGLMETPVEVQEPAVPASVEGEAIRFESVTFGYLGGRRPALRDLSFTLRAGERVGIVGHSGAGKSSVVALLLRFYDPQQGKILLGGADLRDLSFETLRRRIAVVAQDTYLFHGTVAENLRFGRPDAGQAELEAAARAANAHEFIAALPQGYETVVGERGVRLSGGQRQRIAIARAVLKDAPVLVLDEATSSVDGESEAAIQDAPERLMRGRTTLIIAHRLSSVVDADRILVLEEGRLVETGRHADLLRANGVYARLMAAQRDEGDRGSGARGRGPQAAPSSLSASHLSASPLSASPLSASPLSASPLSVGEGPGVRAGSNRDGAGRTFTPLSANGHDPNGAVHPIGAGDDRLGTLPSAITPALSARAHAESPTPAPRPLAPDPWPLIPG
ncbi:MAG: ABC transporter ATP-binding protein, partial [Chloroflexi bacterium]|nr:ABC transporter ATP-binding protein [Chloroflexota bacterium]